MKNVLIFLLFMLPGYAFSQCEVDAGLDQNICTIDAPVLPQLNGQIIDGDVIQLTWQSAYYESFLDKTYYASSMLDDTTILAPIINQHFERSVTFYLTGITSNGEECTDSTIVNFSDWTFLTIDKATGKSPTDTVELWIAAISNWPHVQYEWSPNYMISDTTIERPLVWNDTTTFYDLVITDSLGCKVTDDVFEVYVTLSSIEKIEESTLNIYPNPVSNVLNIEVEHNPDKIEIYSIEGQKMYTGKDLQIDVSTYPPAQYVLNVYFDNEDSISKVFQKIE